MQNHRFNMSKMSSVVRGLWSVVCGLWSSLSYPAL